MSLYHHHPTLLHLHCLPHLLLPFAISVVALAILMPIALKSKGHLLMLSRSANKRKKLGKPNKPKQNAKEAQDEPDQSASATTEFAGNASDLLSTSEQSHWLKSQACTDWNTDTGATSHMTPHQHWFCSYSPHVVAIQLADNSIIHSAGMGSVEFQPVIDGIPRHPVVLHDVLHVPNLGSNLLSLFHLTQVKGYIISIEANCVHFHYLSKLLLIAMVTDHNVGYLNGHVIVPPVYTAHIASTHPLDFMLWHHQCSHINIADLKHMYQQDLVIGMKIQSHVSPDPICEPCIFGKQKHDNIPKTASHKMSLLALVHTDLKGPLPVQT